MDIVLDIGHTNGRVQPNGVDEHALVAAVASGLDAALTAAGHTVAVVDFPTLTNSADLTRTVQEINRRKPDVSISLHADWADNPKAAGGHVCYFPTSAKGKRLAAHIAKHLADPRLLPGRADKTVPRRDLYVLKATRPVAVLVECGFMSNAHDLDILRTYPELIAAAITLGVGEYERSLHA